jgi:hypothetical protein
VGEVALWGRVVEHEQGYRAEYARPTGLWVPLILDRYGGAEVVVGALARRSALSGYGVSTGLIDGRTGCVLDLADVRHVFVPESRPHRPLRELLPSLAWPCLRACLITATVLVASLAGMAAFAVAVCVGVLLPFVVASTVYGLVGPSVSAAAVGFAAGLAVVASYVVAAFKFGLYETPGRTSKTTTRATPPRSTGK